jgi:hypothetical protein
MTSKLKMIWRTAMVPWKIVLCLCLLFGVMPQIGMLLVVIASVAVFMLFIGFLVKCICGAIYGGTPDYEKFRANGGHPYWSFLPPPVNTDSLAIRVGGRPEPQTDFVPPASWLVQCGNCGARNEDHGTCWHCGGCLAPRAAIPAPSVNRGVTYDPRTTDCPGCGKPVREIEFGKFELGVRCPFCATVMQIIPVTPDPTQPCRTMDCECGRLLREPCYGTFETGVSCSCGRIMFITPQAV